MVQGDVHPELPPQHARQTLLLPLFSEFLFLPLDQVEVVQGSLCAAGKQRRSNIITHKFKYLAYLGVDNKVLELGVQGCGAVVWCVLLSPSVRYCDSARGTLRHYLPLSGTTTVLFATCSHTLPHHPCLTL